MSYKEEGFASIKAKNGFGAGLLRQDTLSLPNWSNTYLVVVDYLINSHHVDMNLTNCLNSAQWLRQGINLFVYFVRVYTIASFNKIKWTPSNTRQHQKIRIYCFGKQHCISSYFSLIYLKKYHKKATKHSVSKCPGFTRQISKIILANRSKCVQLVSFSDDFQNFQPDSRLLCNKIPN